MKQPKEFYHLQLSMYTQLHFFSSNILYSKNANHLMWSTLWEQWAGPVKRPFWQCQDVLFIFLLLLA